MKCFKIKNRKLSKKGISPIVATVLLIGFIVAIILLVFLWGKNYIEELAEKRGLLAEKEQECINIKLEVVKACWEGNQITDLVIRNNANIPIHKFAFRVVGKEEGEPIEVTEKLGEFETKSYKGSFSIEVTKDEKVDIIPYLRVALGHYIPCSKQKITAKLYCPTE